MDKLLELNNVTKIFRTKRGIAKGSVRTIKAADSVSFHISQGESFGIIGESGCGKTTLANCILKLLTVSSGEILYSGQNIGDFNRKDMKRYRKNVQIIFQDPYSSLNPKKRVGWLLDETLLINTSMTKLERNMTIDSALASVGLESRHSFRYPGELSGGQRQRVAIALAIILNPELIIADEPVSSLDVSMRMQILTLMKNLQKERGLSYIYISHDLSTVSYMCDRTAVMYSGRIVETGPAKVISENPLHPYTRMLYEAVPKLGKKDDTPSETTAEVTEKTDWAAGCAFAARCPERTMACDRDCRDMIEAEEGHFVMCINPSVSPSS